MVCRRYSSSSSSESGTQAARKPGAIQADKGYDANALVTSVEAAGAQAIIPPRSNRIKPRQYDRGAYRERNLIERFFNRIKHFRRIATRYDKLASSYLAFVRVVCAVISYRYM